MNGNGARRRLVPGSFGFMSSPTPPSGPSWPDPGVIAQLANALFQASPNASPGLPLAPTLPAALTGVIPAPVSGSPASPPGLPQPGGSPGVFLPPVPSLFDLGALPL